MRITTNYITEWGKGAAVCVQRDRDALIFVPTGGVWPASEGMI